MKEFNVTVLGSSAAIATNDRNLTSHLVNHRNRLFLIDCGEGTQFRLREMKIRLYKIKHIFISHLHGDHYFGLIGLISTMHLLRRTEELHVYGPAPLKQIIEFQLESSQTVTSYPLIFHPTQDVSEEILYDDGLLTISSFPLQHRVPTTGFVFREKEQPWHLNKEAIDRYGIPINYYSSIIKGNDYIADDGEIIPNSLLTFPPDKPRCYAFCSDTVYSEEIVPSIINCDLLYHEATFMHELVETAFQKMHSTNVQAAMIALKANAKRLMIGHFSARYEDLSPMLDQAQATFSNTFLAVEGEVVSI